MVATEVSDAFWKEHDNISPALCRPLKPGWILTAANKPCISWACTGPRCSPESGSAGASATCTAPVRKAAEEQLPNALRICQFQLDFAAGRRDPCGVTCDVLHWCIHHLHQAESNSTCLSGKKVRIKYGCWRGPSNRSVYSIGS